MSSIPTDIILFVFGLLEMLLFIEFCFCFDLVVEVVVVEEVGSGRVVSAVVGYCFCFLFL